MDGSMNNTTLYHLNCPNCGEFISFNRPESTDEIYAIASSLGRIKLDSFYSVSDSSNRSDSINAETICNCCHYTFRTLAKRNFDL